MSLHLERKQIEGLKTIAVGPADLEQSVSGVVILCHGFGASGEDLVNLSRELAFYGKDELAQVAYLFPAAPISLHEMGIPGGRCWWPISMNHLAEMHETADFSELANVIPSELPDESQRMERYVDFVCNEYNVGRSNVVLGGFSQGAMLACDVGLRVKGDLGGLILWSGTLIAQPRWSEMTPTTHSMNIVQSHGTADPVLPFSAAETLRDFLMGSGNSVRFHSFPGQHQIDETGIRMASELIAACL